MLVIPIIVLTLAYHYSTFHILLCNIKYTVIVNKRHNRRNNISLDFHFHEWINKVNLLRIYSLPCWPHLQMSDLSLPSQHSDVAPYWCGHSAGHTTPGPGGLSQQWLADRLEENKKPSMERATMKRKKTPECSTNLIHSLHGGTLLQMRASWWCTWPDRSEDPQALECLNRTCKENVMWNHEKKTHVVFNDHLPWILIISSEFFRMSYLFHTVVHTIIFGDIVHNVVDKNQK